MLAGHKKDLERKQESTLEALPPLIVPSNYVPVTTTIINFDSMKKLSAAKMEDRRACFNKPATTTIKDSDSTKKLMVAKMENRRKKLTVVDSIQRATSDKQQRPARKRKCSGS
ncbi:hypothetical protein Tco_1151419 [Tanacetum coccineum]